MPLSPRIRARRAARLYIAEMLEPRTLLSTISWINRGTHGGADSDNFNAVFGNLDTQARAVINADIQYWQRVINNFNYSDATNTYKLTIFMNPSAQGNGAGGVGANTNVTASIGTAPNDKPSAATIGIGWRTGITATANSAAGWYLDPTPFDNSEFQGTLQNAFVQQNALGLGGADLLTGVMHEMGHAMGLSANSHIDALATNTNTVDTIDTPVVTPTNTNTYWLFQGPSVKALWTSYDSGGAATGPINSNGAQHFAPGPSATAIVGGVTYHGDFNLMNAFFTSRSTMSDSDVLMLKDAYGYTVTLPDNFGTFYDTLDSDGTLRIGGTSGNDTITISQSGTQIFVALHLGTPAIDDPTATFTSGFSFGAVSKIVIDPLSGSDTINISGTGSIPVQAFGDVGGAALNIQNCSGGTLTSFSFVGASLNLTSYNGISSLSITGTGGADNFIIQSAPDSLIVDGAAGNDSITMYQWPGNTTVRGGDGNDFIDILGNGNIAVDGGTGTDEIGDDPQAATDVYSFVVSSSSIIRNDNTDSDGSGTVSFSNMESMEVTGQAQADTFIITATPGPASIRGGAGNDTFQLGNFLFPVSTIASLTMDGQGGNDTLSLDDEARTAGGAYSIGTGSLANATNVTGPAFNYLYSGFEGVQLATGSGADNITIGAATSLAALSVFANGGTDIVNFGSGGSIPSPSSVSLDGGSGANTVIVNGSSYATTFNFQFNISATAVSFFGIFSIGGAFTYSNFQGVSITGTGGADVFNVTSTAIGCPITVVGDGGADVFNISSTAPSLTGDLAGLAAQLNITGGTNAVINISEAGQAAADNVTVNENNGLIFSTTLGWTIHIPGAANTGGISFTSGAGNDLINVLSTFTGEPYTISAGAGDDETDVEMGGIAGPTTLNGGDGTDRFVARDTGNASPTNAWAMNTFNVVRTRTSPAQTTSFGYFNTEVAQFVGTAGVDTFAIQAANPGEGIQIDGEGGNDVYTIGTGTTSQMKGNVVIYGGSGGNDSLIVDDSADSTPRTLHIDTFTIGGHSGDNLFDGGGDVYSSDIFGGTTVKCGSGADTIYAIPNVSSPLTIQGNNPTTAPGDTLTLGLAAAQNPIFTSGGVGAGSYTFSNLEPLAYTGIESAIEDNVAPTVPGSSFDDDLAPNVLSIQFSENVAASISAGSIQVMDRATMQPLSVSYDAMSGYDAGTNTASFTFSGAAPAGFPDGTLADGNYRVTIPAGSISDAAGNPLSADYTFDFFVLSADANHDRTVDTSDFTLLAQNFSTGASFSHGDFNYDGMVNAVDFNILATQFGQTLAAPAAPLASAPASSAVISDQPLANLFGEKPVKSEFDPIV